MLVSFCLHPCQHFSLAVFFIIPTWQVWGSTHCSLDFLMPDDEMLSIFSHVYWPSVFLLWRNVYLVLFPSFKSGFGSFSNTFYDSFSYFGYLPLFGYIVLAHIFSHSAGFLLVLLTVSHALSKLFSLLTSHLFIFYFVGFAWEDWRKKKKNSWDRYQRAYWLSFLLGLLWFKV